MSSYEQNDGIRLMDVIKLFWKKIVWLALALAIGVAAGATFGFVRSTNNKTYGSTLLFYVNPEKEGQINQQIYGVYGNTPIAEMIGQLDSGLFAEYIFLDENGLPATGINADIDAKVAVAKPIVEAKKALTEAKEAKLDELEEAIDEYNYATKFTKISVDKEGVPTKKVEETIDKRLNDNTVTPEERAEINAAVAAAQAIDALTAQAKALIKQEKEAVKQAQAVAQDAINAWKLTENYAQLVKAVSAATTYQRGTGAKTNEKTDTVDNTSFIMVTIKHSDKDFAESLRERMIVKLPEYVEDNMYVPDNFDGTNCALMSRVDDVVDLNAGTLISTLVKNGILFGFAAAAVACVVVLVLNINMLTNKDEKEQTTDKE